MKLEDCYVGQKVNITTQEPPDFKKYVSPGEVTQVNLDVPFQNVVVNCPYISDHMLFYEDNCDMLSPR